MTFISLFLFFSKKKEQRNKSQHQITKYQATKKKSLFLQMKKKARFNKIEKATEVEKMEQKILLLQILVKKIKKEKCIFLFVLFSKKKYNNNGCYNFTDYSF